MNNPTMENHIRRRRSLPGRKGHYFEKDIMTYLFDNISEIGIKVYFVFTLKCVYETTKGKKDRRTRIITNNGQIQFSYDEAEGYGITRPRFKRALLELHRYGLLDIAATGQGIHKVATLYTMSDRWRDYGTDKYIRKSWPKTSTYTKGFRPGNRLGKNAQKIKTSDMRVHGEAVRHERRCS